jgi:hypothetical protein
MVGQILLYGFILFAVAMMFLFAVSLIGHLG